MGLLNEANKSLGITRTETPKSTGGLLKQAKNSLQIQSVTQTQPTASILSKDKGFLSTFATKPAITTTPTQPVFKPAPTQPIKPTSGISQPPIIKPTETITALTREEQAIYDKYGLKPEKTSAFDTATKSLVNIGLGILRGGATIADLAVDSFLTAMPQPKSKYWTPEEAQKRKNEWNKTLLRMMEVSPAEKLKNALTKFADEPFLQPSQSWQKDAQKDFKSVFSKEHIGETIVTVVPGLLSSMIEYRVSPTLGFASNASQVADDILKIANENGINKKISYPVSIAFGMATSLLDRLVPDKAFRNKETKKMFVNEFVKKIAKTVLKEGTTEMAQEDIQIIGETIMKKQLNLNEVALRNAMAGFGGAMAGGGYGVLGNITGLTFTPPSKTTIDQDVVEEKVATKPEIKEKPSGLTPEVKTKVVEKVEERKIETIAKPIEYIEKQVETIKDIKSVKTTLSSIRNELDNAIAEAEGKSIVATEQRAGLDTKKIGELKRIASLSKEYRAGNWDILKKKHGNLVDYVVVDVQKLHPEMEYDEAIDFALNLPTKAEESARTPIIRELEKKQKKLSKYLELLKKRQDELKVKTDNELDKQWREILSAQEKLIKIVSVAREQLPLGEGKKKVSRLEARVNKISKKISNLDQETIDRLSLATYNQLNKKENISKAVKYVKQNPEKALKVLTGEIEAPNGILRNAIYVAMQNEAIGDVELARKIASIGATRLGQEISILTEIDPNSPVKVMSDVIKIKEEAFNKRFGKQRKTEVTEKSVNELKKSVKKPDKYDWNSFINSIQC